MVTPFCLQGNSSLENGSIIYGFAFVDCAALRFWVGSIDDDASCSALGALLMQVGSNTSFFYSFLYCTEFNELSIKFVNRFS